MECGPVRRRSQLRMPHRLASDGPLCYAAGGSRFGCNGPACSAPSTTLSRRARLRKIIPRQVATISCMRLVNTPMAPATCSVWSESPGVRARDVRGRRAARPPFSSTCSKIALTGCSVASSPSAASLVLPDERRRVSFDFGATSPEGPHLKCEVSASPPSPAVVHALSGSAHGLVG